jgi:ADP-ribose pyrophosphatase
VSGVILIGTKTIHTGAKFSLAAHTLRTNKGEEIQREFLTHPGSVVLLPLLPDERVVLLRNYRHTIDQVLWELPAGTRAPNEPFETAARRELREETGYRAGRLKKLREFYPAPGIADEHMVLFLAENLVLGDSACEADEEIAIEIVPFSKALEMANDGRICDAKTLIGLWHWHTLQTQASLDPMRE